MTPYLRADLGLSDAAAALPNSVSAVGMIAAGLFAGVVHRRLGSTRAVGVWIALVGCAAIGFAWTPSYPVVLASALAFGVGAGALLAHVNRVLGADGTVEAETHVARANVWAMVAGIVAPTLIAAAATTALSWRVALLVPVPVLAVSAAIVRRSLEPRPATAGSASVAGRPVAARTPAPQALAATLPPAPAAARGTADGRGSLPRGYWVAWTFTVLAVCIEFGFVVWGASVAVARIGLTKPEATSLASLFVVGEFLGRLALSSAHARAAGSRGVMRAGVILVVVAAVLLAAGSSTIVEAMAFLAGGLGVATLYPLAVVMALGQAPGKELVGATRLTLASGGGILVAPLVLGVGAQAVGLTTAWLLVPVTGLTALAVLARVPKGGRGVAARAPAILP